MKVVEIPQYGIDHLRVAERATPEPGPVPGDGAAQDQAGGG